MMKGPYLFVWFLFLYCAHHIVILPLSLRKLSGNFFQSVSYKDWIKWHYFFPVDSSCDLHNRDVRLCTHAVSIKWNLWLLLSLFYFLPNFFEQTSKCWKKKNALKDYRPLIDISLEIRKFHLMETACVQRRTSLLWRSQLESTGKK
jgi:hypothetical protein